MKAFSLFAGDQPMPCTPPPPPPRPLTMVVAVPMVLALAVVEMMEVCDGTLANALHANILSASNATFDGSVSWPHKLAVRVQMALLRFGSDLAEPVGRCLDAALSSITAGSPLPRRPSHRRKVAASTAASSIGSRRRAQAPSAVPTSQSSSATAPPSCTSLLTSE